jgi:hypothetical protein
MAATITVDSPGVNLRSLLDEEDVQIHAIGIHDLAASREEVGSPWILEELAKMTGRSTPYY